jgi:hypothetical protein
MGTHMKTTIEISDPLFAEAKKLAAREGVTVRALVEQGLREVVKRRSQPAKFKLRKVPFKGKGLSPHVKGTSWDDVRELTYTGRGS